MAYTTIDDGSSQCQSVRWTGNASGSTRDLTFTGNSDMKPDMAIAIAEDATQSHFVTDSSRNWDVGNKELLWDSNTYEGNTSAVNSGGYGWVGDGLTDGIQSNQGSVNNGYWNANAEPYYAACWKINNGTTSSNTDGSITSTVQVNQDAGISIILYTGTGSAATIGHGLGVTPDIVIFKRRDSGTNNWDVQFKGEFRLTGNTYDAKATNVLCTFTSTTTDLGSTATAEKNAASATYVAYAYASKQGFSKFGSYVGNGHSAGDGTFVYTGFKPAFIMTKRTDTNGSWLWHDGKWGQKVSTGNASGNNSNPLTTSMVMESNSNAVDDYGDMDILSNGFKLRSDSAATNAGTAPYIYMAWAENPFVTSTGTPTTAR